MDATCESIETVLGALRHLIRDGFIDKSHLFQATSEQTIARVIKKRIQQRYETFLKEYYDFENKNSNQHPDVDYNSCRDFNKSIAPKTYGIKNGRKSNLHDNTYSSEDISKTKSTKNLTSVKINAAIEI